MGMWKAYRILSNLFIEFGFQDSEAKYVKAVHTICATYSNDRSLFEMTKHFKQKREGS